MIHIAKRKAINFVDSFIPQRLLVEGVANAVHDELFSTRVTIGFSVVLSAMIFFMFITRVTLEGFGSKGIWLLLLAPMLLSTTLYMSKRFQDFAVLRNLFWIIGLIVIPYRTWSTGGIDSTVASWFLLIPIVTGLITNPKLRLPILIVALLELIVVTFPRLVGIAPAIFEPQKIVQLSVLITLMLLVSFLVWVYQEERKSHLILLDERASQIRILSGLLRICSACKKIHDKDDDSWKQMELYIDNHSEAQFSHSFCPECLEKEYRKAGLSPPK